MLLMILGLALWIAAHLLKRIAPQARASLGGSGRAIMSVVIVGSIVLMALGYQRAPVIDIWSPPAFFTHINNLLMVIAVWFFFLSRTKGALRGRFRHPQLGSVKIWALAHLLVNGDLASIILFGGLLGWAVASLIVINRSEGPYQRPEPGTWGQEGVTLGITIVALIVISFVHTWVGVPPFGAG